MRIRVTFSKTGSLRYIGHLDLHKIWERASRRAKIALMYSQGFHPQPKLQLASALPLGFSSRCELVDLWIDGELDLTDLPERLTSALPAGIGILHVEKVEEKGPPLQTQTLTADYEVTLFSQPDKNWLQQRLEECMAEESLPRERRGKAYDLRPLVEALLVIDPDPEGHMRFLMRLASREGATGRPEEVLDVLGIPYEDTRVERCLFTFK